MQARNPPWFSVLEQMVPVVEKGYQRSHKKTDVLQKQFLKILKSLMSFN